MIDDSHKRVHGMIQEVVVTRQPIFDRKREVFLYELLFQSGKVLQDKIKPGETANSDKENASQGIESVFISGLRHFSNGKPALIKFNRQMILNGLPFMFPSDLLGIELEEDTDPEKKVTRTLEKMKNSGYLIMVNDRLFNEGDISLVKLADIVGVDFRSLGLQKRFSIFESDYARPRFLARSVETPSDFETAAEMGYHYFQGGFFCKADLVPVRNIPGYKLNFVRILKEINKPEIQFDEIENILKRDISITYKLLRFVNSAAFGLRTTVQSIRQALTFLGEVEIKKWLSMIIMSGVGTDKPHELIINTLIRARFCESLALALNLKKETAKYFLMGMFSMVDAFLDRPMAEILTDLPLDLDIKSALIGKPNDCRTVLDMVIDYENAEWSNVALSAGQLKLDILKISNMYLEAVEWGKFF